MVFHTAFGLTIRAPFALPATSIDRPDADEPVDVTIACEDAVSSLDAGNPYGTLTVRHPMDVTLAWGDIGAFRVRDGCRIDIVPDVKSTVQELNLCLSGAVFAMLLHQRGLNVMHGSVFNMAGAAVAVLAAKGGGKSTLAMAMDQAGYPLLSDDILALDGTGTILALPGFAQIKLWPDALRHLGHQPETYIPLRPAAVKRGVPVDPAGQGPLPLRHIFVLQQGGTASIRPLNQREALLALLPHWYLSRFDTQGLQALQALPQQFAQCTQVVQDVAVSLLLRPQSLAQLPHVVALIEGYVVASTMMHDSEGHYAFSAT